MTFTPMYDLESLTESQRQAYYLAACERFQVPPELNLLAFIWMDSGDGKRNLVLYAKKGATDIIRANLGISVLKLTKDAGPGYVAWIAEGIDVNSRRMEQAVGSASIEGLTGRALSNAVMLAQTRAVRRLTLQFAGGGLLDETELNETTTDINRSSTPLSAMATLPTPVQPIVLPNSDPGKDITEDSEGKWETITKFGPPDGKYNTYHIEKGKIASVTDPEGKDITNIMDITTGQAKELGLRTRAPFEDGTACPLPKAPAPFSGGSIIPEKVETIEEVAEEPKKRRTRRTKAQMEAARGVISLDNPVSTGVEKSSGAEKSANDDIPESQRTTTLVSKECLDCKVPVHESPEGLRNEDGSFHICNKQSGPPYRFIHVDEARTVEEPNPDIPVGEEFKALRAKMQLYTDARAGILVKAGMTGNIIQKVRVYTEKLLKIQAVKGKMTLTRQQWQDLFRNFEVKFVMDGPESLVKAIEEASKV